LRAVTRLQPRTGTYENALRAYRAASLSLCRAELHGRDDPASRLLNARALLRASRPDEALREIGPLIDAAHPHSLVAERDILHGVALMRLGAFETARSRFVEGRVHAIGAVCTPLVAEAEYYFGLLGFSEGDFGAFSHSAQAILNLEPTRHEAPGYAVPLAHTRARAFEALACISVSEGDYESALLSTRAAIGELDKEPNLDAWIFAHNLFNLAARARDLDREEDVATVRARLGSIGWTPELGSRRWGILNILGRCSALSGDLLGALRAFRLASEVATCEAERVITAVERASLAYDLQHTLVAQEELDHAREITFGADWEHTGGNRHEALVLLAAALAPISATDARSVWLAYEKIRLSLPILSFTRIDPEFRASESYAEGRVLRAEGQRDSAVHRYRDAFLTWRKLAIAWRAASAAIELAELGDGDEFVQYARSEAARRPGSWLAHRVASLTANSSH